jgi:protein-L-isoaspartate(D-aspartate) O-methyltransferase
VGGAVDFVPESLLAQLKDGGRLVAVEGTGNAGVAKLYTRDGDVIGANEAFNSSVMPLPGFQREVGFTF